MRRNNVRVGHENAHERAIHCLRIGFPEREGGRGNFLLLCCSRKRVNHDLVSALPLFVRECFFISTCQVVREPISANTKGKTLIAFTV